MEKESELENIIHLTNGKKYKAIQLYVDDEPRLIIGSAQKFHAELVEEYLVENNIPYKTAVLEDGAEGPAKEGIRYKIIGAGYVTKNEDALDFSDKSIGYNISPDEKHLKELKKQTTIELKMEDPALKKIKEKELLEAKLKFLHPCLVGDFEKADVYFDELKPLIEDVVSRNIIRRKYNSLKSIFNEEGEESLHKQPYIKELTTIRNFLFIKY